MRRVTSFCILVACILLLLHGARSEHAFCQNAREIPNLVEHDAYRCSKPENRIQTKILDNKKLIDKYAKVGEVNGKQHGITNTRHPQNLIHRKDTSRNRRISSRRHRNVEKIHTRIHSRRNINLRPVGEQTRRRIYRAQHKMQRYITPDFESYTLKDRSRRTNNVKPRESRRILLKTRRSDLRFDQHRQLNLKRSSRKLRYRENTRAEKISQHRISNPLRERNMKFRMGSERKHRRRLSVDSNVSATNNADFRKSLTRQHFFRKENRERKTGGHRRSQRKYETTTQGKGHATVQTASSRRATNTVKLASRYPILYLGNNRGNKEIKSRYVRYRQRLNRRIYIKNAENSIDHRESPTERTYVRVNTAGTLMRKLRWKENVNSETRRSLRRNRKLYSNGDNKLNNERSVSIRNMRISLRKYRQNRENFKDRAAYRTSRRTRRQSKDVDIENSKDSQISNKKLKLRSPAESRFAKRSFRRNRVNTMVRNRIEKSSHRIERFINRQRNINKPETKHTTLDAVRFSRKLKARSNRMIEASRRRQYNHSTNPNFEIRRKRSRHRQNRRLNSNSNLFDNDNQEDIVAFNKEQSPVFVNRRRSRHNRESMRDNSFRRSNRRTNRQSNVNNIENDIQVSGKSSRRNRKRLVENSRDNSNRKSNRLNNRRMNIDHLEISIKMSISRRLNRNREIRNFDKATDTVRTSRNRLRYNPSENKNVETRRNLHVRGKNRRINVNSDLDGNDNAFDLISSNVEETSVSIKNMNVLRRRSRRNREYMHNRYRPSRRTNTRSITNDIENASDSKISHGHRKLMLRNKRKNSTKGSQRNRKSRHIENRRYISYRQNNRQTTRQTNIFDTEQKAMALTEVRVSKRLRRNNREMKNAERISDRRSNRRVNRQPNAIRRDVFNTKLTPFANLPIKSTNLISKSGFTYRRFIQNKQRSKFLFARNAISYPGRLVSNIDTKDQSVSMRNTRSFRRNRINTRRLSRNLSNREIRFRRMDRKTRVSSTPSSIIDNTIARMVRHDNTKRERNSRQRRLRRQNAKIMTSFYTSKPINIMELDTTRQNSKQNSRQRRHHSQRHIRYLSRRQVVTLSSRKSVKGFKIESKDNGNRLVQQLELTEKLNMKNIDRIGQEWGDTYEEKFGGLFLSKRESHTEESFMDFTGISRSIMFGLLGLLGTRIRHSGV